MLKIMLTAWIILHLFLLSVFHKNMKRFEPLYLVSSVIVAFAVLIAGLVTSLRTDDSMDMDTNYTTIAFINNSNSSLGEFQSGQIILTSVVAVILLLSSGLVITMATILCCRAYKRKNSIVPDHEKQHRKVLYEMMPLLAYPILLMLLSVPVEILAYYDVLWYTSGHKYSTTFRAADSIASTIMVAVASIACSCALIIHVLVVLCIKKRKKFTIQLNSANGERITINETTSRYIPSETHFLLPLED